VTLFIIYCFPYFLYLLYHAIVYSMKIKNIYILPLNDGFVFVFSQYYVFCI